LNLKNRANKPFWKRKKTAFAVFLFFFDFDSIFSLKALGPIL